MEARRLEQQRRYSAKSNAVQTLPSTQDEKFNLRLIDLYRKYPCLWNQSLKDYEDVDLKRKAWQDIADEMGAHLKANFVRHRILEMQYQLNIYNLKMIEYKMYPDASRQPEKLYYFDAFASIVDASQRREPDQSGRTEDAKNLVAKKANRSIADIFKQRIQQPNNMNIMRKMMQRLVLSNNDNPNGSPRGHLESGLWLKAQQPEQMMDAAVKSEIKSKSEIDNMIIERIQGMELPVDSMDSNSLDGQEALMYIPSVVRKRLRQNFMSGMRRELEGERHSQTIAAPKKHPTPLSPMKPALPGDSVSKTRLTHKVGLPKSTKSDGSESKSEDEDVHRLQWRVRLQRGSRRQSGNAQKYNLQPPLLQGMCDCDF
ncbi:GH18688 [Drosophila grimshawi]|uniref:GH18688 n=1 Tax=Drosophila grimshawi TaxID=7222 RepID=B4JGU3_DROGR|nr:GH18688 [Drosophila grimshawi]